MKNIPIKYSVVIVAIIIILIGVIVWQGNRSGSVAQTSQAPMHLIQDQNPPASSSTNPLVSPVMVTKTPAKPVVTPTAKTIATTKSTGSYVNYVNDLAAAQNTCSTNATNQYKNLYSTMSGSSFSYFYDQTSGGCYMRATGTMQQPYSTTTTGYIYFRSVTSNSLIAECIDPTGTLLSDANWICTNKLTGATINKSAFNALSLWLILHNKVLRKPRFLHPKIRMLSTKYMKISTNYSIGFLVIIVALILVAGISQMPVFASTCVQLTSDLSYGQTDSTSGGPIMMLQTYLQLNGFFSSNSNGHFGPATLSAVQAFQSSNGISNTGYVGPLTRGVIIQKTCSTSTTNSVVTPVTPTPVPVQTNTVSNMTITSPMTGQVLSVGSTTVISWSNSSPSVYNISLEQPGGAGAGFIALNQSPNANTNQYVWNVGKIYSSQTNATQTLSPGTYRIRLSGTVSGASSADQVSGWFTVVAQQFAVNSVMPSSAYADNATSIVLFGTGFTNASSIYFDTNYSSLRANNTYVSPDGTVLVFTIPTTVPAGSHTLFINNGISSTPVTVQFNVSAVQ